MRLKVTVDGRTYDVEVEVAEPELGPVRYVGAPMASSASGPALRAAPAPTNDRAVEEAKACRSPLAGVVSDVVVAAGDEVTAEQPVVVLEAMKMLTTITSPVAGRVKAVEVKPGDAVKQGQLLVELE